MRVIIIGAGGTGRELLRRLGDVWEAVVVDTEVDRLEGARAVRDFESIEGDGSSAVVLRRAGLDEAAALVAASSDDDTNLEAIRLAREAGLLRVVGVAADPERLDEYRGLDVPAYAPHQLAARNVELALEPRRIASSAFAGGKAEAIEIQLSPDAAVVGTRLRDLHASGVVVAALLRDNDVIIPDGRTALRAGDRVTVVGAAADYSRIVAAFTTGISSFPLGFGRKVAVAVRSESDLDGPVAEAISILRISQADTLSIITEADAGDEGETEQGALIESVEQQADSVDLEIRPHDGPAAEALADVAEQESIGIVVAAAPSASDRFGRFKVARLVNDISRGKLPMLLARSGGPYTEIAVPARRTPSGESAVRAAIDLAETSTLPLRGIASAAPNFVATRVDTVEAARAALEWLQEEAAARGVTVEPIVEQGNPVRVVAANTPPSALLVVGQPRYPASGLRLGVSGLIAARASSSVLMVPGPR